MNEKIDLTRILEGCPKGTEFYSPLFGTVYFRYIDTYSKYPIEVACTEQMGDHARFTSDGRFFAHYDDAECMLFPSKDNRDWSTFRCPTQKFSPYTLNPFDKVLARHKSSKRWFNDFYSFTDEDGISTVGNGYYDAVIPYNEETKHLVGTSEEAPEYYKYWED